MKIETQREMEAEDRLGPPGAGVDQGRSPALRHLDFRLLVSSTVRA